MKNAVVVTAVAGLAAAASAQSAEFTFSADATEVMVGDTVNFTVSVSYTGLSGTGYFGGFIGSFLASNPALGTAGNFVNFMGGEGTAPTAAGADVNDINVFNSALLGTDDQSLGTFFTFSVVADAEGVLSYDAQGVTSLFNSDFIFDQAIEVNASVVSDSVNIVPVPAPGAVALLGLGGLVATRRRR